MKTLIFIALFTPITAYGSYPQINVSCIEDNDTFLKLICSLRHPCFNPRFTGMQGSSIPPEWLSRPDGSPSVLKALEVSLADRRDGHSDPALNISWAINIDHSNAFLIGTWIGVGEKSFRCSYRPPVIEVNVSGHDQIWFHFTSIPAQPAKVYEVHAFNLPTPDIGSDPTSKSKRFDTPDCSYERMKHLEACLQKESERKWDPNVSSVFSNGQVEVSFTSTKYSTKYGFELWRCALQKECLHSGEFISENECFTEGESRWTTTLQTSKESCDSLHVMIRPHFPNCDMCDEIIAQVDCSPKGEEMEHTSAEPLPWTFLLGLTCIMMLLVSAGALMWYTASRAHSGFGKISQSTPPVSVLVVYPAEDRAFQRAVGAFAEFLQSQWRCSVAIDMWQRGRLAEQGPMRWLATQVERADRVVVVCAPRTEPRETAAGRCHRPGLRDHTVPASTEDVFSLALNAAGGQAQRPAALRKYCAVHLGEESARTCLPAALRPCQSFSMMKDVERLGRHLHSAPGREACCFPRGGLKQGTLSGDASARLREAIWELEKWQNPQSGGAGEAASLITVKAQL